MNQHFLTVLVFALLTILGASAQDNTTQRHLENSSQTLESNLNQILKEDGSERKSHVLFFFPIITKSAKITFMPVAEKMAERGHKVSIPSFIQKASSNYGLQYNTFTQYQDKVFQNVFHAVIRMKGGGGGLYSLGLKTLNLQPICKSPASTTRPQLLATYKIFHSSFLISK